MNHKKSKKILEKIQEANKIFVNCHTNPDPDAIGSALALKSVLEKHYKKEVDVYCPSEITSRYDYIKGVGNIIQNADFSELSFENYDILFFLDSSAWDRVVSKELENKIGVPDVFSVSIDHHHDNLRYGTVNILHPEASSTAEILYFLFKDWGVEVDKQVAEYLLTGIIGDSGAFRYATTSVNTLKVSIDLIERGADKNQIIRDIYFNEEIDNIIMWGEILSKMQFDKENGFVWSAIPYETYKKLGEPGAAKETAASNFAAIVKGAEFGIIMVETKKGELSLSLRSKTGFDTSKIASDLGGGGHAYASAVRITNMDFDKAVERALGVARKHAKKNNK